MSRWGVTSCVIAAVLFGASTPALWSIADDIPALVLAGLLYLGAALAVVAFSLPVPTRAELRPNARLVLASVVFGGALGPALLVLGLTHTSAASASVAVNMELPATLLLAVTVFREHLGRRMILAGVLITAAGVVLAWQPGSSLDLGVLAIAGACACWGIDNGATARIDRLTPQQVTLIKGLVAGSVNLALGLVFFGTGDAHLSTVVVAVIVGAVGYGVSITLWVRGAQQIGAARAQVLFASAPFIGAVLSWVLLGEDVLARQVVAMVLAGIGVAVSLRSSHEHAHAHEPMEHTHEHDHADGHHTHEHVTVSGERFSGRHAHAHAHPAMHHSHAHVPDLHHHHPH